MNNRINEPNLVNLSGELNTLNQLDAKEALTLSFPFDHLYACHSGTAEEQLAQLDKELEKIPELPVDKVTGAAGEPILEVDKLSERLNFSEYQNRRLRHLLLYHLDLIQHQNDLITKKEKQNCELKLENDSLRNKVTRMDRRITVSQRHNINPAPVISLPPPNVSPSVKTEPGTGDSQMVFNSLTEFLVPDNRTNPYIFNNDIAQTKPLTTDPFDLNRPSATDPFDLNRPSATDLFDLNRPPTTDPFVLNRPPTQDPFILNRPSATDPFDLNRPSATEPFDLKRPSTTDLFVLTRPSATDPFDLKRPSPTDPFDLKRPSATDAFDLKRPSATDPFDLKRPSATDPFDLKRPSATDPFDLNRPSATETPPGDTGAGPSNNTKTTSPRTNASKMIENKRSYLKKDIKTEPRSEPLYTVNTNSGNTVIQKIQRSRRRTGALGSLSRLPKTPVVKTEPPDTVNTFEDDKNFEGSFSVNKKSKMINTYGKSKTSTLPKKTPLYTGSLTDRLQLIDTTPTGEDPYQLGEADMREQSPIPKLMLQKTNHGRMKICSDLKGDSLLSTRRIYDAPATETSTKMPNKIKLEKRYNLPNITPYSATKTTTHTATHTSSTATDTCTHMSTYTHVPKPSAHTSKHAATLNPKQASTHTPKQTSTHAPKQTSTLAPKQTSTLAPKQTSTLTSTNACTHMSTYTHTTRNTTARSSTSSNKSRASKSKSQSSSRKSSHTASKKAADKTPLTTAHTSPLMATLTPIQALPLLSAHMPAHDSLQAALTAAPSPLSSGTHLFSEIKKESLDSQTAPINLFLQQPDLDCVKKEPDLDWPFNYSTLGNETSLCDFSYGENSNLTTLPALDPADFRQLMDSEAAAAAAVAALENIDSLDYSAVEKIDDKIKKEEEENTSLLVPKEEAPENRRGTGSKRGRKRALSTGKNAKQNLSKAAGSKTKTARGKAASRGKKSPLPGMMTKNAYHTLVGDPDLSWYFGLDPDVKMEDIDQGDCKASTVEVPRWREKPVTCVYSLEGTENLDDKVFEKRHQKLEAEERRQLRWHMRRIREQRHVERLRMRQRDPWYNHSHYQPSVYTIWPQPQRDVRMIEITDTIPVMAFGEDLPDIPPADFMLPWVRTSKPLKRSKRSKTLH